MIKTILGAIEERATSLSLGALVICLAGFVWWNLQSDTVSLVAASPGRYEVKRRGAGWPFPAYTGEAQWSQEYVPMDELFKTPTRTTMVREKKAVDDYRHRETVRTEVEFAQRGQRNRWLLNGLVGGLLVVALMANILRAYEKVRPAATSGTEFPNNLAKIA